MGPLLVGGGAQRYMQLRQWKAEALPMKAGSNVMVWVYLVHFKECFSKTKGLSARLYANMERWSGGRYGGRSG